MLERQTAVRLRGLVAAGLFGLVALPAFGAIQNPGFETGTLAPWSIQAAADAVTITGAEGPANFQIYAQKGITVSPYRGQKMLRLGTPKQTSESQSRGANRVAQTFQSDRASIRVAVRVFSFEFRGDDRIKIDMTGASGVTIAGGAPFQNCSTLPCQISLNVGGAQAFLDSGWQVLTLSGLPTNGANVTLSYEVVGSQNQAHATWMYADDVNSAPQAVINYNPSEYAIESDSVVFDCGQSVDPDGDVLTCQWQIAALDVAATGGILPVVFPDDGLFRVDLTVSDGEFSASTHTNVQIHDQPPLVSALNVEVLAGGVGEAVCRYVDPGANDEPQAAVSLPLAAITSADGRENSPPLASGFASARFRATQVGTLSGNCVVDGIDVPFNISVLSQAQVNAKEPAAGTPLFPAPVIVSGGSYVAALGTPDDIDVFEIRLPGNALLPVNSEVSVRVDVPADYDAILLMRSAAGGAGTTPFVSAPFVSAPFVNAPFVNVPFVNVPFVNVPFVNVPFVNAPFVSAPFVSAPFVNAPARISPFVSAVAKGLNFTNFPLSQVGFAAPDGSAISGSDVGLGELGSLNLGGLLSENLQVMALSANLGTKAEELLVKIGPGNRELYLAIVSQNGGFASAPYSIRVEASTPPAQRTLLGDELCAVAPLVATAPNVADLLPNAGAASTLIVMQHERFMAAHGLTEATYRSWLTQMASFFNAVGAKAVVLPYSTAMATADASPCSIAAQNAAAAETRTAIRANLTPSIQYVQLVGGIDVIQPYYVPDETVISNEALFAQDLWVLPGKPLSVATAEGYNITDAYYVDQEPLSFRGRELYIEDVSVSRMVETPAEILAAAQHFVSSGGNLVTDTALATGYDFFKDGTDASVTVLNDIAGAVTVLNNDDWTSNELRCSLFGSGSPGACQASNCNALNAHMTYNAGISAAGFKNGLDFGTYNDIFNATESAVLGEGTLNLSIGCHSGLSVPDKWAVPADAGLPFDAAFDWAQAPGTWLGPWGFGLGDTDVADRGTEGIIPLVLEELRGGETLGRAVVKAKQRYALSVWEFDVYDEKSMINLSLFGMPQAKLATSSSPLLARSANTATPGVSVGAMSLTLDGNLQTHDILQHDIPGFGTYYSLDGNAQSVMGRPLQGVIKVFEAQPVVGSAIHGVALRAGTYEDFPDSDPVFSARKHDWIASIDEPDVCVDTMSPTQLGSVTTFKTGSTTLQSLLIQGGQFRCTEAGDVRGDLRVYRSMTMQTQLPSAGAPVTDFDPPRVVRQDVTATVLSNDVTATLAAVDAASGMREIIALIYTDLDGQPGGDGAITSVTTGIIAATPGATIERTLLLPNAKGKQLAFQYIDHAGNLLMKSLKGSLITALAVDIQTSVISTAGSTSIAVFISNFATLVNPVLTLDLGDGNTNTVQLIAGTNVVVDPVTGSGIATYPHTYAPAVNTATVVATVRAGGASGTDSQTLFRCSDSATDQANPNGNLVRCAFTSSGTQVSIDLTVAGAITNEFQYRLRLPQTNTLIKWDKGSATGPSGISLVVTKPAGTTNTLRFSFNAAGVGWNGITPLQFMQQTQAGVKKGQAVGFADETAVFTIQP